MEKFYSTGQEIGSYQKPALKKRTEEFLSFGFWKQDTRTYVEAADNLLEYFIDQSGISGTARILNVACGYGTETFAYYDAFKPEVIKAVDVTAQHVRYANQKAETLRLSDKIQFYHGNACEVSFPDATFTSVFGIEGPAHFNTREKFFRCAHRVLGRRGNLLLTDIILGSRYRRSGWLKRKIMAFTVKWWVVPNENWVDQTTYENHLEKAGFKLQFLKPIGKQVFPGYAKNGFSPRTIMVRMRQRGLWGTLGLTIISYLLGYLYRQGLIEYIYVKSVKV